MPTFSTNHLQMLAVYMYVAHIYDKIRLYNKMVVAGQSYMTFDVR